MPELRRESIRSFIGFISGARPYSYISRIVAIDLIDKPEEQLAFHFSFPTTPELHYMDFYDGGG
jgi:hypothetical protein